MKVQAIQQQYYNYTNIRDKKTSVPSDFGHKNIGLDNHFYYPMNINFGFANDKGLKRLVAYGLPCMYTEIELIDPKAIRQFIINKKFNTYAKSVFKILKPYEDSIKGIEKDVYDLLKAEANHYPDKKIKELVEGLLPIYKEQLINRQQETFKTLEAYSYSLPEKHKKRFDKLMEITYKKINEQPVVEKFSVTQFKYDLEKIKNDVEELDKRQPLKDITQLVEMSNRFNGKVSCKNQNEYIDIIQEMEDFILNSTLKNNEKLINLIKKSKSRLNKEEVIIPFKRKAFIYDLNQILKDLPDEALRITFDKIARKLPTSQDYIYAYITKISSEPSEKIIYRLLWPSFASIEHITARALGGKDNMKNYGVATASINSELGDDPFKDKLTKFENPQKTLQKYIDRHIELALAGVYKKENVDPIYIENFKDKIATETEGAIILDTSKLYENGRFTKEQFNI